MSIATPRPAFVSTPGPLTSSSFASRPALLSPRRFASSPLSSSSSSPFRLTLRCRADPLPSANAADTSRRTFLSALLAIPVALVARPLPSHALSKKRIMAKAGPEVVLSSGVTYRDITVGKGYVPRDGDAVAIHYSLFYNDLEVESSRESQGLAASPLGFTFGVLSGPGAVMRGVNLGMDGMKVGGLRLITVPAEFAYGSKGKMPLIPPNATVDFAVSLLSCKRAGTNPNSMIDPKAQAF